MKRRYYHLANDFWTGVIMKCVFKCLYYIENNVTVIKTCNYKAYI